MTRTDDLRWLIAELTRERGLGASHTCDDDERELFDLFRALVNTREAIPASEKFLEVQNRVLGGMIKEAGIADAAALPHVPLDARISLWRGDITTLRADAIVNAANSGMTGCWAPLHYLPARFIVHTVGPIVNGGATATDARLLANCYESCLEAAAELGCLSIAFCCISTGVFGFPQEAAAAIAVGSVLAWLDHHDSALHVVFNVFTDADERIYH